MSRVNILQSEKVNTVGNTIVLQTSSFFGDRESETWSSGTTAVSEWQFQLDEDQRIKE